MKFLKKATLATAIAAAPFAANAELIALDDTVMSNTTGQAGVTIEIDIAGDGISIGEVEYIDEGSLAIENIQINNADITQTIDVDADGNLVMGVSAINDLQLSLGNTDNPTDANVASASGVMLRQAGTPANNAELVNNLSMQLDMGASTTTIYNMSAYDTGADADGLGATFDNGTDPASNSLESGVVISASASIDLNNLDVGLFGYTDEQAMARADAAGNGDGVLDSGEEATYNQLRNGSAIQITGVQFYDTDAGGNRVNATVDQKIWAQGGTVAQGGGVYIAMGEMNGTLEVGGVTIGGSSIGSVKVSDINLSGMTQRIYGH
ncbi:MAG: hypothetical protein CMI02_16785 [Oceanospirillaceae bacterium]|nr:hypothetical protein [Oceanospirillaceae bacterium]MBT13678.1 hypothetical protein [Oceanospirillaceae bacterium]|tara:strand:- start:51431 stop:52399 length:969 start_codon:yes stop_codon:yes gene_type:complete